MKKGVDGGYGRGTFIEIRVERITPMVRRLARPYFRVGIILSVCLSSLERVYTHDYLKRSEFN